MQVFERQISGNIVAKDGMVIKGMRISLRIARSSAWGPTVMTMCD